MTAAKKEAAAIVDQANKRAIEIVEEAKAKALVEAERVKASAQAEIELATSRAKEELRSKVVVLALAGAEKILESSIDQNAHTELVNKLAAEL
jgi:F-type H+-transporting ATPase subunit b